MLTPLLLFGREAAKIEIGVEWGCTSTGRHSWFSNESSWRFSILPTSLWVNSSFIHDFLHYRSVRLFLVFPSCFAELCSERWTNVQQFFQYFPSFSVWPLKNIPLIIFAMISHICMLNEGLRSMECKSQVLEVTIPFIFSVEELFFTSPEKPFKTDLPALRLRKKS